MNERGRKRIFKGRLLKGKPLELEQYSILMSYLQHENSSYWTKNGFFLIANSIFLGFIFSAIKNPDDIIKIVEAYGIVGIFPIVFGFIITLFWIGIIQGSERWINLYHSALVHLEEKAFPNIRVLRGRVKLHYDPDPDVKPSKIDPNDKKPKIAKLDYKKEFRIGFGGKRLLKVLISIFLLIWILIGVVYVYFWWPPFQIFIHNALEYYFDIYFKFIS